ncbi:hypothetical protein [Cecembia rubra]|uniref:Uncharacterized protein n=1 Tax=Cecembia rubra TaxID=1485585 RepID=A0A2P8E4I7_9BACT|nr:hypothetical protein [Cecembia rubra]PSL04373.1 hypothetical protein CLV48_105115 [Cecembia rubra]
MKNLHVLIWVICLASCTSQKKMMNSWIGASKEILKKDWGEPINSINIEPLGEILVFVKEVQYMFSGHSWMASLDSGPGGPVLTDEDRRWKYTLFMVDKEGLIHHWEKHVYLAPPGKISFSVRANDEDVN